MGLIESQWLEISLMVSYVNLQISMERPQPRMTPILHVANGVNREKAIPGQPRISHRNVVCSVHMKEILDGKMAYRKICR